MKKAIQKSASATELSGLGEALYPYNLFSVFLEFNIINPANPDISYVPIEYIRYLDISSEHPEDSDLLLITMLFAEHNQEKATGKRKISLDEKKYKKIANQFSFYCHCELLRRAGEISTLSTVNLFDPNYKTEIHVSAKKAIKDSLRKKADLLSILLI